MFISVKEAVELTGKSQTTIYRLCKKRIRTDYVKVENSQYLIDKEFLQETYPTDTDADLIDIENDDIANNNTYNESESPNNEIELEIENKNQLVNSLANEITERIGQNADEVIEQNNISSFNFEKISLWDSVIGISVSALLIIGFILMLYFNSK